MFWIVGAAIVAFGVVVFLINNPRAKWVSMASRYLFRLNVIIPAQSPEMQDAFMKRAFAAYAENKTDQAAKGFAIDFFREFAVERPQLTLSDKVNTKPWVAAAETLAKWGIEDFGLSTKVRQTLKSIEVLQDQLQTTEAAES